MRSKNIQMILLAICLYSISCSDYLNEKPDKSTTTINSTKDLQSILDNLTLSYDALLTAGSDEYYLTKSTYDSRSQLDRNIYTWEANTDNIEAWAKIYSYVYRANIVITEIKRFKQEKEYDYLMGQGLFLRAFAFYIGSQLYCTPYSKNASNELGLPLRVLPDVEVSFARSTLKETYDRMISDLKTSEQLLLNSEFALNRGNHKSVLGLLARIYLSMRDYENALKYSSLYLKESRTLLDYNSINETSNPAFQIENPETTFYTLVDGFPATSFIVDTSLYDLYNDNDLRKVIFYYNGTNGEIKYKGSYNGRSGYTTFYGITTSEILLIHAESAIRMGEQETALDDLNYLLSNRYKHGTFTKITEDDRSKLLKIALMERRKELAFRGLRWSDVRRLNLEGQNISLSRLIGNEVFTLPPNDLRWTWLIPSEAIILNKWEQNRR
ncbi:hypothetical protein COR50_11390 [Chitinophaga caeni]|uniref:RagB/SusD family nutrient uptake outer membrane protein n=1 Tax=Chitinophaga caeni TaxID=2029983 RepID=A0A291QUX6_9BACT|nr:RagB/SusD family nutrient uptake outer membrane protein [Chitinophaga caeni]ATL47721.1 hypothetical protein COR50_11390 [Chitinophaga caeni]